MQSMASSRSGGSARMSSWRWEGSVQSSAATVTIVDDVDVDVVVDVDVLPVAG